MKILVVAPSYPPEIGGIAAHVYYLCRGLAKRGHDVTAAVVLRYMTGRTLVEDDDGVEVHRVPGTMKLGPIKLSMSTSRLRRHVASVLRKRKFDVVHCHGHAYGARATLGLDGSTPLVGTMHSSIYLSKAATERGQARLKTMLRRLDAVTAPSTEICEVTDRLGLPAGKCVFIPNGVDIDIFRPGIDGSGLARELGIDTARPVVLCARRIAPKNGVLHFARAVKGIVEKHPEAQVVFAGSADAGYVDEVTGAVEAGGASSSCKFVGAVPNARMPDLMSLATVSVLPSLVEATSITGLESMAAGLPLVGTTVGGIPELIDDFVHGILVPPADPGALAAAISRLLSDRGLAERLGAAARERAVAEFSWDTIASRFEATYSDADARREAASARARPAVAVGEREASA